MKMTKEEIQYFEAMRAPAKIMPEITGLYKTDISQERLKELFDYREDGFLTRKIGTAKSNVDDVVGSDFGRGYLSVSVDGKSYLVHRLIWLWHKGSFPNNEIDHLDRDKTNNKIGNMRDATHQENQINSGLQKNNSSGMKGVSSRYGKWHVSLKRDGVKRFIGSFIDFDDAVRARLSAENAWSNA